LKKNRLKEELESLKRRIGLGLDLHVVWVPGHVKYSIDGTPLSGEVKGNTIIIYVSDPDWAIETLKHKFLDYIIFHEIEGSYKDLINEMRDAFFIIMYRRKERVIERLSRVI